MRDINIQDVQDNDQGDFYSNFREKLLSIEQFPSLYTFKFITPVNENTQKEFEKIFDHPSAKIQTKASSKGNYHSLTIEVFVNSADDVIDYYKKVSTIDKVIML